MRAADSGAAGAAFDRISGQGPPHDLEVGLDRPVERAEPPFRPGPELGPDAVAEVVRDPPGPGLHAGVHLVQELPDGGVVVGPDRRQEAHPSTVALELAVERLRVPGVQSQGEGNAPGELQEPVDDLPRVLEPAEVHERNAAEADDPDELLDEPPPLGDEVEYPPHHGGAEHVVAERHPRGVGQYEREGDAAARLLHHLGEHRAGQVEPDHRHPRLVKGKRDEAGPHPDFKTAPSPVELRSQQLHGRLFRLGEECAGPVVELGSAVEPDRARTRVGGRWHQAGPS